MLQGNYVSHAAISINAPASAVWQGLTDPEMIRQYMMGAEVASEWKEGADITWSGEFKGKKFTDKGKILHMRPGKLLQYTHYTPAAGQQDKPENYHTVTIELTAKDTQTEVTLTQDNNGSEQAQQESEKNWSAMLGKLKQLLEQQ